MKFIFNPENNVWNENAVAVVAKKWYATGEITAGYGDIDAVHQIPHNGVDFACPPGTEIHAPYDGVVSRVVDWGNTNMGKAVFVQTEDGKVYGVGHLSDFRVHEGQVIHKGDLLALSGNTGNSTGPHLHYSVYDGTGHAISPGAANWDMFQDHTHYVATHDQLMGVIGNNHIPPNSGGGSSLYPWIHSSGSNIPQQSGHVNSAGQWLGERIGDGASTIFSPIGDGIAKFVHDALVAGLHSLPMVATVVGLVCFLLTIAMGSSKPYAWGLMSWAFAAIVKVMTNEMGV